MVYQRVDPRPFTSRGFHAPELQHREFMVRVVVNQAHARNGDFPIVSFMPLPNFALHFGSSQDILHEFLEDHRRITVSKIQPSHLGQALVCLVNAHDKDLLVNTSAHQFGDVQLHFVRHNQGKNWRAMNFKRDC
jgi:hypothetical protein